MDPPDTLSNITGFATTQSLLICAGLLCLFLCYLIYNKYGKGISHIPGPVIASYTGFWRFWDVARGSAHLTHIRLHQQYGPLVRIGPKHVSVGDPKAINIIYGLKRGFTKTAFYPIQSISWKKRAQMNLFSTRNEAEHRDLKKPVAGAYSMSALLEMEGAVDSCSDLLMKRLDELGTAGKAFDLGDWLQYYAFDVVGVLTFNEKLGFLERGFDVDGMVKTIQGILRYSALCGQVPYLHNFLLGNPLLPYIFPSMESFNQVLSFTLKAIHSRGTLNPDGEITTAEKGQTGKDQLSKWIAVKDSDATKLSTRDIIVQTSGNVFAGSDTTTIALRAIFYHLMRNPSKMTKSVAEIDRAQKGGQIGDPISYKDSTTHLPYTQAVIKEAMRIHPSVGLLLERHVPPGGVEICERHIPAGTIVGVNAWVVHHDPAVFPEPDKFHPERWIESGPDELKRMEASFFAFGAGSRTCIGKNFSLMEMSKVVPLLLRRYRVELEEPGREWVVRNNWFVQQSGLICKVERRC